MFLKPSIVYAGIAENIVVSPWLPVLEFKLLAGKQANKMHRK